MNYNILIGEKIRCGYKNDEKTHSLGIGDDVEITIFNIFNMRQESEFDDNFWEIDFILWGIDYNNCIEGFEVDEDFLKYYSRELKINSVLDERKNN